jgi:hypothetical protein
MPNSNEKKSWKAMIKFAQDEYLTPAEWQALSWLTLIDRNCLEFRPGNVRWAKDEAERKSNLDFFRNLGVH